MKPLLIFVLGLAIGAGVMFALKPDHTVEALGGPAGRAGGPGSSGRAAGATGEDPG